MGAQLNVYIKSEDARKQAAFYTEALGGETVMLRTHGEAYEAPELIQNKVMHMVLSVAGGNTLFLSDAFEPATGVSSLHLALTFGNEDEAKEAFQNLAEGGAVRYPFALQPWGAYYGEVMDAFGVTWQIVKM
ncbi:VOC family protein [Paenibacillus sp. GCM10027627]|uniref:VOC family protein n=1 Tax=unclassified Paenibacillus TaxID=185978 RepID=UPI00363D7801